jgi:hypothetical protein
MLDVLLLNKSIANILHFPIFQKLIIKIFPKKMSHSVRRGCRTTPGGLAAGGHLTLLQRESIILSIRSEFIPRGKAHLRQTALLYVGEAF